MHKRQPALPINKFLSGGRTLNFRPTFFFALFFAFGIFCGYCYTLQVRLWPLILPLPAAALLAALSGKKRLRLAIAAMLSLAVALGVCAFSWSNSFYLSGGSYFGRYAVSGVVQERRETDDGGIMLISDLRIDGKEENGVLRVSVSPEIYKKARVSDRVLFSAEIKSVAAKTVDNYRFGYAEKDVRFRANEVTNFQVTKKGTDLFALIRERLRARLYAGMDEDAAAVLYGVLTGDDTGIEEGLIENVRFGGIAHIFAVSGLHIGALFAFLKLLFSKTPLKRLPRFVRLILLVALLGFYGGVCGFSSSVLRATVMCVVFYAAELLAVKSDGLERMSVAMIVCLCVSPLSLFTAGFMLSFCACFGILFFSRTVSDVISPALCRVVGTHFGRAAAGFLSVTLSAQIFTTPALLSSFGYLSAWSFLLNCLFVPIVSAVFAFLLILGVICTVLPNSFMPAVLYAPSQFISLALFVFEVFDFSKAALACRMNLPSAAFWTLSFAAMSDKISLKNFSRNFLAGASILALVASMYAMNG